MASAQRRYITTPIYYVNDVPHVGNAYPTYAADALRRYHAIRGRDVRLQTGTDEHGLKVQREAQKQGMSPKAFVDAMSSAFSAAWPALGIQVDDFVRTTDERHKQHVRELWQRIEANGDLYLGKFEGWYCAGCESYKTEKELTPDNQCLDHRRPVEWMEEATYFFRLSKYQDRLLKLYAEHPSFIRPDTRRNEVIRFVEGGLRDLSVSRTSFTWGIPVPGNEHHVMYVWFDALSNYWTTLKDSNSLEYWNDSDVTHIVGKDIVRFHAVYWPAFLMSAGLALPSTIWGHGFLTFDGQKMSKSLRNSLDPLRIAKELSEALGTSLQGGSEVLRFCLFRGHTFGEDGDFGITSVIDRYNSDLAKNVGNLVSRFLGLCARLNDGCQPRSTEPDPTDTAFLVDAEAAYHSSCDAWEALELHVALERTVSIASLANQYIEKTAPWSVAKTGRADRVNTILATVAASIEMLSRLLQPMLPTFANSIRERLGLTPVEATLDIDYLAQARGTLAAPGVKLPMSTPLFPAIPPDVASRLARSLAPMAETRGVE